MSGAARGFVGQRLRPCRAPAQLKPLAESVPGFGPDWLPTQPKVAADREHGRDGASALRVPPPLPIAEFANPTSKLVTLSTMRGHQEDFSPTGGTPRSLR